MYYVQDGTSATYNAQINNVEIVLPAMIIHYHLQKYSAGNGTCNKNVPKFFYKKLMQVKYWFISIFHGILIENSNSVQHKVVDSW